MYFDHVKSLRFADSPNYGYLKGIFKDLFIRMNYTYDNILFDWEIIAYQRAAAMNWRKGGRNSLIYRYVDRLLEIKHFIPFRSANEVPH